jgi:hypothetical protein
LCENCAEHAGKEDVEQVEEGPDAGDDRRVTVRSRRRQPIQARGNRYVG